MLLTPIGVFALVVASASAFYLINRAAAGVTGYYIWKLVSGRAHGGRSVSVNGVRIYYETFGEGKPVLILHGGLGHLEDMQHQIRALASTRFVIAADSRGHGRSTDADEPLRYTQMADDMVKLLDALGVQKTDIVGFSDGGIIGLDLAMRYPTRVRRLVAIGSNYDVDGLIDKPDPAAEPPRRLCFLLCGADPADRRALYRKVSTLWLTQPHYTTADLARINVPTLIMAGQFDVIKRSHSDQLTAAIPGAQEAIIPDGTHSVIGEYPDTVNARILKFLDQP